MSGTFLINSAKNTIRSPGERIFISTVGISSWTVPADVTSISIVVVGGGGGASGASFNFTTSQFATGAGGGGGGLAYATDIAVTPGEILEINVGTGGDGGLNFVTGNTAPNNIGSVQTNGVTGGSSWVRRQGSGTFIVLATGGGGGVGVGAIGFGGPGGIAQIGEGGSTGGQGGNGYGIASTTVFISGPGGGGAAGYIGPGGQGTSASTGGNGLSQQGGRGTHGGGAGGTSSEAPGYNSRSGGYGGGVGIYGQRLDGVAPSATSAAITETGPGSAIQIGTNSSTSVPTSAGATTYSPNGYTGLSTTGLLSGSTDDGWFGWTIPWTVIFLGGNYTQVFLGTNSYLTFGSGTNVYSGLSSSNPPLPKIMVGATDNSSTFAYAGVVGSSPNRKFIIRYEGTNSSSVGAINMIIEYHLYEAIPSQIDVHILSNARAGTGTNGIYNASGSEAYALASTSAISATRLIGAYTSVTTGAIDSQYVYAGGGAGAYSRGATVPLLPVAANQGRSGAVRIVWPGTLRRFPDINVGSDYRGSGPPIGTLSVTIGGPTTLIANWTNPTNLSESPIVSWIVKFTVLAAGTPPGTYSTSASTVEVTLPNMGTPITSYTESTLVKGRTYRVEVRAVNSLAAGDWSNSVVIAPAVAPSAPTIGTATSVDITTASVSYTAPADAGGSIITSYTAVSSPGGFTGTVSGSGSGSITVSGLTALATYTFTVYATNVIGNGASSGSSNSVQLVAPPGQVEFTTAGNYNWTVPVGVTSISIVLVGAGGTPNGYYGGGGGGGLTYKNNLSVTAGTIYPIQVARIGVGSTPEDLPPSFFNSATYLFAASGGRGTVATFGGYPGGGGGAAGYSGNGGPGIFAGAGSLFGTGGAGGGGGGTVGGQVSWSGGSGAPHYGGAFATYGNGFTGSGGAGGGGGAGGAGPGGAGAGGGVGIYGEGPSGTGGAPSGSATTAGQPGNPGSNGVGKLYGGGAGGPGSPALWQPGGGAVRIIWPGNLRVFPSTRTANE
jgi:hypothetical protein